MLEVSKSTFYMWDLGIFFESKLALILSIILITSFVIEIFYIIFFYFRAVYGKINISQNKPALSVVIAARDEAHNLEKFLPLILKQDYWDFEVIVVDHASTDETDLVLKRFSQEYKNLVIRKIPYTKVSTHSKKFALTIGIRAAKNDVIIFTDADCYPASREWLKKMASHFSEKIKITLGYGAYKEEKGLLDKHIRTDTMFIAMQYIGFALRGLPYMGVGRNIAWRKSFFEEKNGFQKHIFEPSGSDDLFVNHNANKNNIGIEISHESFTYSLQPKTWKDFVYQKSRHFGSTKYYKFKYKLLLTLEPLARLGLLINAFAIVIIFNNLLPLIFVLFREILFFIAILGAKKRFKEKNILLYALLYDVYQPILNLIIYIQRKKHSNRWK